MSHLIHVTSQFSRGGSLVTESQPQEKQEPLPIEKYQRQIVQTVSDSPVTVVVGTTGCGKTTYIPAMLYQSDLGKRGKIVCTLPTRPAAMMAATFVARRSGEAVGGHVGYHVRFDRQITHRTKILYMTDGMLLQRLHSDPYLRDFSVVMVDEVHERRQTTDILLGYLKSLLRRRSDLRVVVSSATLQARLFSRYFGEAPVVNVWTRQYPIEVVHRPPRGNPFAHIARLVQEIHERGQDGDVLAFLPGIREIIQAEIAIGRLRLEGIVCLPMHGDLDRREQERVFQDMKSRKVILSTNIAETALTIPGVRYVLDLGLARELEHNPESRVTSLWVEPITQASAIQRAGRAGRTGPGVCIRLYSEHSFKARQEFSQPDVQHADITDLVLKLKALGVEQPENLDLLTPLPKGRVAFATEQLRLWGAVDQDGKLTPFGKKMATIPLTSQLARMALLCAEEGMIWEGAQVAAFLSIRNITHREGGVQMQIDGKHGQFRDERGDAISFLRVAREYKRHHFDAGWCAGQGLDPKLLERIRNIWEQVLYRVRDTRIARREDPDLDAVHRVLVRTWGGRLCAYHKNGVYRLGELSDIRVGRESSLYGSEPSMIVAYDLLHVGVLLARYPLAVPVDMFHEVQGLYGELALSSNTVKDSATLRVSGALQIFHPFGHRLVRLDVDCLRSHSRSLRLVKDRSMIVDENRFSIDWLRLSGETKAALVSQGVQTLADVPKQRHELEDIGLEEAVVLEIINTLKPLGYVPKSADNRGQAIGADALQSPPPEGGEDWLVQNMIQDSVRNLGLSRGALMRLLGCQIETVKRLLELTKEQLKRICNGNDVLYEEVLERLASFGFELVTDKQKLAATRMTEAVEDHNIQERQVSRDEAITVLGEDDFHRFERYHAAKLHEERAAIRNELIVRHMGLQQKASWWHMPEVKRVKDDALEREDLEQEATFGAIAAIAKFRHYSGYRYSTYAMYWMRQAITRMIMDQGVIRIPVHVGEKVRWFLGRSAKFKRERGIDPSVEELAEFIHRTPEYVEYMFTLVAMKRPASLDQDSHDEDDARNMYEKLFDKKPSIEEELVQWERQRALRREIDAVLAALPVPERSVRAFKLHYGLEDGEKRTLEQIGQMYGVTRERIRQLIEGVLQHFRTPEVWSRFCRLLPSLPKPPKIDRVELVAKKYAAQEVKAIEILMELNRTLKRIALPDRAVLAFKLFYGLTGESSQTLEEIGDGLGISRQRAHQLRARVEKQLSIHNDGLWQRFLELVPHLSELPPEVRTGSRNASVEVKPAASGETVASSPEAILNQVAVQHGFTPQEIRERTRKREVVEARWRAMVRLRDELKMSFVDIAAFLGLSDHTTAVHGYARGQALYGSSG